MTTLILAGHAIEFSDCHEIGQGGPDTCTMSIDGEPVVRRYLWGAQPSLRFHPSPLDFNGDILIPMRVGTRFYLVRINPRTTKVTRLTWRGEGYMRLLKVAGNEIEFATWHDGRKTRKVRLR